MCTEYAAESNENLVQLYLQKYKNLQMKVGDTIQLTVRSYSG